MPTPYLKAEHLPAWNAYAVMKLDHAASPSGGNGVLERTELARHSQKLTREIERLEQRQRLRPADLDRLEAAKSELDNALGILDDLDAHDAQGLVYLPDELLARFSGEWHPGAVVDLDALDLGDTAKAIPDPLRRRAAELLLLDDHDRFGRLSADILDRARQRYLSMDPRSAGMVRTRDAALREIEELGEVLGHHVLVRA